MKLLILVFILIGSSSGERISYKNYKVYRITPNSHEQVELVKSLEKFGANFWRDCSIPGRHCDVLLSPELQPLLQNLAFSTMQVETFIHDVESLVVSTSVKSGNGLMSWDSYYGVNDIYGYLQEQATNHSEIATVMNIGNTFEGRQMHLIKIAKSSTKKPVIFVEANAHAREWITSAVATYLINDLLNSQDPQVQRWTEDFEWYVLPVFNPDGLEYSRSIDRMWRKNRSNTTSPTLCRGVDLNRSFDYNWCGVGSSINPCSETYCGTSGPNAEPETKTLTTFVETLKDDLVFYLSIHSYSQFIMFPFGDKVDSTFYDSHMKIAEDAAAAAEVRHGTKFLPGNWLDILYPSTGDSMDWAKSKLNANLSLTYELRDTGRYGFLLPPSEIRPSSEEFVDSLKPVIEALRVGIPKN